MSYVDREKIYHEATTISNSSESEYDEMKVPYSSNSKGVTCTTHSLHIISGETFIMRRKWTILFYSFWAEKISSHSTESGRDKKK